MSIPQTKATERWILDHWADLQPQDVGPFEARSVSYSEDKDGNALVDVSCTALTPPNPRTVHLSAAVVEAAMLEDGALKPEPEPDETPAKAKASK